METTQTMDFSAQGDIGVPIPPNNMELDPPDVHFTNASTLQMCQDLIKNMPDSDKPEIVECLFENIQEEILMSVVSGLFEKLLEKREPMLTQYVPKDFMEYLIQAVHTLYNKGIENVVGTLVKAVVCKQNDTPLLPFNSLPFNVLQLILGSLFGSEAESFHINPAGEGIALWLRESCERLEDEWAFLDQINKIFFPDENLKYILKQEHNEGKRIALEVSGEMETVEIEQDSGQVSSFPPLMAKVTVDKLVHVADLSGKRGGKDTDDEDFEMGDYDAGEVDDSDAESPSKQIAPLFKVESVDMAQGMIGGSAPDSSVSLSPQKHGKKKVKSGVNEVRVKQERQTEDGNEPGTETSPRRSKRQEEKFPCSHCDVAVRTKKLLRKHEITKHCLQDDGRYKCLKCERIFNTTLALAKHEKAHQNQNWFKCRWDRCAMRFPTKADLQIHIESHSRILCDICGASFKHKSSLKKHLVNHNNEQKEYKCTICDKDFPTRFTYKFHMTSYHATEKPYACLVENCGQKFTSTRNLKHHQATIHKIGDEIYKCSECEKTFILKDLLRRHMNRFHTASERLPCDECKRTFKHAYSLKHHKKIAHSGDASQLHKCHLCEKALASMAALLRHKAVIHRQDIRPHKCDLCEKTFPTRRELMNHDRMAHNNGNEEYTCPQCTRPFNTRQALQRHNKSVHLKIRDHQCDKCNAAYSEKSALLRHEKIHLGIKDFHCQKCGNSYFTAKHLKRHERHVHMGMKGPQVRHQCDKCEKTFVERRYLIRHQQREHLGNKDYDEAICALCGQTFSGKSSLNRHHRRVHQGIKDHTSRDFQCELCAKTFVFKQSLQRHMQTTHKQDVPQYQCVICNKRFASDYNRRKHEATHTGDAEPKAKKKKQQNLKAVVKVTLPDMQQHQIDNQMRGVQIEPEQVIEVVHYGGIQQHQTSQHTINMPRPIHSWGGHDIAASYGSSMASQFLLGEQVTDTIRPIALQENVPPDMETIVDVGHGVGLQHHHMGWAQHRREHVPQPAHMDMGGAVGGSAGGGSAGGGSGGGGSGVDVLEIPAGVRFIKVGHQIIKVDGQSSM